MVSAVVLAEAVCCQNPPTFTLQFFELLENLSKHRLQNFLIPLGKRSREYKSLQNKQRITLLLTQVLEIPISISTCFHP